MKDHQVTNLQLSTRRDAAVPRGIAHATAIYADRADNSEIWDVEGRRFIDFAGGIAVLNIGHRHPRFRAALSEQLDRFTHTAFQVIPYESYIALAEQLNRIAPVAGPAKSALFSTGAEAVENAIKVARAATGRSAVIAFTGAFHGRTMLTIGLTGKTAPYKRSFGPMPAEIYRAPFPAEELGVTSEQSLGALAEIFRADVDPDRVAAIIIEPVQGEGGFYVAPPAFLMALRALCDDHGILLIADEVQSGFARTGRMFAIEHSGVQPDLITAAKSLAGGMPLSALIGRAEILDSVEPGGLGGTYAGNPMACAGALAVLDIIEQEGLLARADAIGLRIRAAVEAISARDDRFAIANLRGLGAMIAFDLVSADGTPDNAVAKAVTSRALDLGLVLLSCGVHGNVIRLLMPLTIADDILDEGLALLDAALAR